ncbi:MAG: hypothetical protein IIC91_08955, partial [Chloroflexi bacterium]|nr:hypothetical protein [Chloroflexota bacterium]
QVLGSNEAREGVRGESSRDSTMVSAVDYLVVSGVTLGVVGVAVGLATLKIAFSIFRTQSDIGARTTKAVARLLTPIYEEAVRSRWERHEKEDDNEWIQILPEFPRPGLPFEIRLHLYDNDDVYPYRCTIRTPSNKWITSRTNAKDSVVSVNYPADFDDKSELEEGPHLVLFSSLHGDSAGTSGVFFVMPGATPIFSFSLPRLPAFWRKT